MKKVDKKKYNYEKVKNIYKYISSIKKSNIRRHRKRYKIPKFKYKKCSKKEALKRSRLKFMKELYRKSSYIDDPIVLNVNKQIGIEHNSGIEYFLNVAENLLDTKAKSIKINLENCSRVWPSAVSMMCSLVEWSEVASLYNGRSIKLKVDASLSSDDRVNEYLSHCGFSNYIGFSFGKDKKIYSDKNSVKIRRELTKNNIEEREDEIIDLIEAFCSYDKDQIEVFNSVVLTEIFNNVTEHGFSHRDMGWWILAQTHPTNKFVSLCISDNGIGIRNSLVTGPQKKHIKRLIRDRTKNDGELIRFATQENISGAITATEREERLWGGAYSRGARRGNGLKRIRDKCASLGISLNILSHGAYLMYDSQGNEVACGGRKGKVFAGTMYHLVVPMEK